MDSNGWGAAASAKSTDLAVLMVQEFRAEQDKPPLTNRDLMKLCMTSMFCSQGPFKDELCTVCGKLQFIG